MTNRLARAVARLEQSDAIQLQILMHVFVSRIYTPLTKSYGRLQESFEQLSSGLDYNTLPWGHLTAKAQNGNRTRPNDQRSGNQLADPPRQFVGLRESTSRKDCPVTSENTNSNDLIWDWRGIPKLHPGSRQYINLSTGWMIYAILRTLFHEQLCRLVGGLSASWFGMPGNCLLMGRLVSHPTVAKSSMFWLPSYHLIWRCVQNYAERAYKLTMALFLLQSEHDIEQFYALMEANRTGEYLMGPASGLTNFKRTVGEREMQLNSMETGRAWGVGGSDQQLVLLSCQKRLQARVWTARWRRAVKIGSRRRSSAQEHLMRHLMCYQIYHQGRVYLRLRPNRTRLARKKLIDHVARSSLVAITIFAVLLVAFTIYILLMILPDFRYVANYPGCYPLLEQLFAEGRLNIYDVTLKNHRLVSGLLDSVENLIIWLDSGVALLYVPTFVYVLNYDILLYWSELQQKLELLLEKAHLSNALQLNHFQRGQSVASDRLGEGQKKLERELEDGIHELQFEMSDFFREVKRVDLLVGDILSASIFIWLASCAFISYSFFVHSKTAMPIIVKSIVAIGFVVVTSTSYFLLGLRRSCLRSYQTLASLMANNRTLKKRQLIKLLEFFTQLNRTSYTLFQHYPYEPTTFITIVGWSFSCSFIAITLFGARHYERPQAS